MRKTFYALLALLIALLFLAVPAFTVAAASAAPAGLSPGPAPAAAFALLADPQPPVDLSDLDGLIDAGQVVVDLMTANIGGIPVFLIVLLVVMASEFVGLADAEGDKARSQMLKQRLAMGTGIAFGLLASVLAIAPDPALIGWQLAVALITGVVRGLLAGIVAALTYEVGRALIFRKKAA
jgi:hypothetical protein